MIHRAGLLAAAFAAWMGCAFGQTARIEIDAGDPAEQPVSRFLYGKFTEHLWWNVYNGLWAQVVRNPSFESWDSMGKGPGRVEELFEREGFFERFPHLEADRVRTSGVAPWWLAYGTARFSLDEDARNSELCQRIAADSIAGGAGVEQPIFLPIHRERDYELELYTKGRTGLRAAVLSPDGEVAAAPLPGVGDGWHRRTAELRVDTSDLEPGTPLLLRIELTEPGTVALDQITLFPADNMEGFDPDIVRMLRESKLPLLRFPGGNFVSGYHWEDGVGPVADRPTRTNPAWGGFEPNHVGADEYLALCRLVGCEPMICINAGNGTAAEAARWVEYMNGPISTPQGALRAKNGHPEPYGVKLWEIGNELYGSWQVGHCTPEEYATRYAEFHQAMSAVDPSLEFLAIGQNEEWSAPLLEQVPGLVRSLAIHELPGGGIPAEAPPAEVFEELMVFPSLLRDKLHGLADQMRQAGVKPRLAITEAQIFTNKRPLPTNDSQAEALFLAGLIHLSIREGDLVEMITHSALVNHGGGLRKRREIVYATPVHWASVLYGTQSGRYPVAVAVDGPEYRSPGNHLKGTAGKTIGLLDAVGLLDESGSELTLMVINNSPDKAIETEISFRGFLAGPEVGWRKLSGDSFMARNTMERTDASSLEEGRVRFSASSLSYQFPAHSLVELVFRRPR